jgi:hypothetical protein
MPIIAGSFADNVGLAVGWWQLFSAEKAAQSWSEGL